MHGDALIPAGKERAGRAATRSRMVLLESSPVYSEKT